MATGKVKWFNNAKGYGFVIAETGGEDLFVHYSSIQMDGYKTLKAGQQVEFDVEQGAKGLHAVNIRSFDLQPVHSPAPSDSRASDSRATESERVAKPTYGAIRTEYAESR